MKKNLALAFVTALALLIATSVIVRANAAGPGQERHVERARIALESFLDDPNSGDMRRYVQNAYGVLIVPEMLSGGFFFGAEFGIGVLMVRDADTGAWGDPLFYSLYGGSFGLQIGGQTSDLVLTLMNPDVIERFLHHEAELKLGAGMGLAVGRVGASSGVATTTNFSEDIYVFAKSKGLYGGFTVDGTVITPNQEWNTAYYGREINLAEVARTETVVASRNVGALHESLTRF